MSQLTRLPDSVPVVILQKPTDDQRLAFCVLLADLVRICKPPLSADQVDTYFGLLADIPSVAIQAAAIDIAASRVYSTWPMPGEIRSRALELMVPENERIGHVEAFQMARNAVLNMATPTSQVVMKAGRRYEAREWDRKILDGLPPVVAYALTTFGIHRLSDDSTCFAQWRDHFNAMAQREHKSRSMPAAVVRVLTEARSKVFASIGVDP